MTELSLDTSKRYTYADYLTWLDDKTRELIHGIIQKMSPAPRLWHAKVSSKIAWYLGAIVMNNNAKCEVFTAPFDVRFPKNGETADNKIDTVVQPDICVVCDRTKLDDRGCCGAPDMIVEILSPSTLKKDVFDKFALYEESGVKEYWIVHPKDKAVTVFLLQNNGKYNDGVIYEGEGKVPIFVFDNYPIDLDNIFEN
ncbi:MAG: Uma2 family endonuclease [Chitinophagaceae bacterium]|jgi:Uma2 family endonuclease|nr:Uma2 family endonuclease [Chitinophagaceae bacterium]